MILLSMAVLSAACAADDTLFRIIPLRYADARQIAVWLGGGSIEPQKLTQDWANNVVRRAMNVATAVADPDAPARWLTFVDILPARPEGAVDGALARVLDVPKLRYPPVALEWQNALLVRGTPEEIDQLKEVIEFLDRPMPMVNIDVRVEDAPVRAERGWGLDFHSFGPGVDLDSRNAPPGDLTLSWARGRTEALLSLFDRIDRSQTTTAVNVTTTSGMPAEIAFGQVLPFFTATVYYDPFGRRHVDYLANAIFLGVQLWCLPVVTGADMVRVTVRPTFSFGAGQVTSPRGESIPIVTYQAAATTVTVPDGESIVIGGFGRARDEANRRFAGLLHDVRVTESSNPTMILTPHIIRPMPD
ncbi:MAG: hypothetical protein H5T86_15405 [Armatimonadetes bacterium]|nr:hypothetical protein [Armatimonadota bacterium]